MANKKQKPVDQDTESLVRAIMDDRNVEASKKLEKILRRKAAKRISDILDA